MRVLFLCNSNQAGGAESYLISLARGFAARGHRVFIATSPGGHLHNAAVASSGVTPLSIDIGPKLAKASALEFALRGWAHRRRLFDSLAAWKDRHGIDVIHLQFKKEQILASGVARELGMGVVWTEHGELPQALRRLSVPLRLYLRASYSAKRIICVSRFVMENLLCHGVAREKVRLCYNGIPAEAPESRSLRERARRDLELRPDDLVVGTLSRLVRGKGLTDLLDAAPRVAAKFPDVKFVIVGDGPQRRKLEAQASANRIDQHVRFTGFRRDATRILTAFDLFVCPSRSEGMPYAVMEAMRAEVPVVACRVGGLPELVSDEETGILVEPRNPSGLAAAISFILADAALRRSFGANSRRRIVERFDVQAMITCTESVFEDLEAVP